LTSLITLIGLTGLSIPAQANNRTHYICNAHGSVPVYYGSVTNLRYGHSIAVNSRVNVVNRVGNLTQITQFSVDSELSSQWVDSNYICLIPENRPQTVIDDYVFLYPCGFLDSTTNSELVIQEEGCYHEYNGKNSLTITFRDDDFSVRVVPGSSNYQIGQSVTMNGDNATVKNVEGSCTLFNVDNTNAWLVYCGVGESGGYTETYTR
ncbi:MAG: hypothetical protein R3321_14325, partial [Nitrososphaeraceae archaeon]|nr:hypothetical protein [Nitrososphaeraceae archaeon]